MSTVMVVDDKEMMRDSVGTTLERAGFAVVTAEGGEQALAMIAGRRPDVVVTDLRMPGLGGLELLERIRRIDEELPVVVMTAFGAVDTAVKAIKMGAFDYITKPFEGDELIIAIKRAVAHAAALRENAVLRAAVAPPAALPAQTSEGAPATGLDRIIGDSPAMRRVKQQIVALAESQGTVMICGESGCGKEVVARAIHELSPRRGGPMLAVNCAALSESLLESELFGHERGAFTGADKMRKGRFELADGGSLLLDEVSEVSPSIQAKLLRVLQERAFERVGSSVTMGVDVRVIATSNRDLPKSVAAGEFRQDLFFRLNVLPLHLPPLRDRVEDVPPMASAFVGQICRREGRTEMGFDPSALALLQSYHWPGNVRELQNICERAVVLHAARAGQAGTAIPRELVEPWLLTGAALAAPTVAAARGLMEVKPVNGMHGLGGSNGGSGHNGYGTNGTTGFTAADGTPRPLEDIERDAIVATLHRFNGHRVKTARALGIGVRTLGLKLKKWKQLQLVESEL